MKITYSTLRKSYKASRALVLRKQSKIEDLLVLYRLQGLARGLPRASQINQLRTWTDRESRWALDEGFLGITILPNTIKKKANDLFATGLAQTDLIELLIRLTRPNGNGLSSVQNYAQMEHGKAGAGFGRLRDAAKHQAKEAAIAKAESDKLLAERQKYRTWSNDGILGQNRGGASRNRFNQ